MSADGMLESDHLHAIGYIVARDLLDQTNSVDINAHIQVALCLQLLLNFDLYKIICIMLIQD